MEDFSEKATFVPSEKQYQDEFLVHRSVALLMEKSI
jgi:hypothetical protein